jgi:PAS domain S-box-containing protein
MSKMRIDGSDIDNAKVFEILLDSFPDIIHSANDAGNIVFTNKKAEELLGYTKAELLTMNVSQLYAATVLSEVKTGFQQLKEKGVKSVESLIKDRKGNLIPVEIRSFAIYDDDGKFIRTFSILRDIRPLKELQAGLVHASRLAAVGELASGIMHDIANPLSIIMMATDLSNRRLPELSKDAQAADDVNGFVADIQKAAQRIEKLVDHMRRYVRNRAETMEQVDLGAVVADALFIAGNKIAKGKVKVDCRVGTGAYWVLGCPNRLEQVFVNLVSNAADAMEQQAVRQLSIAIAPESREQATFWRVSVTDTGTGIPAEIQNDIFQSFFTTKEKGKGTGLGLSIVRSILNDHHGEIRVESTVGHGATFHVVLPATSAEAPSKPAAAT